jgi:hypothetical protein
MKYKIEIANLNEYADECSGEMTPSELREMAEHYDAVFKVTFSDGWSVYIEYFDGEYHYYNTHDMMTSEFFNTLIERLLK